MAVPLQGSHFPTLQAIVLQTVPPWLDSDSAPARTMLPPLCSPACLQRPSKVKIKAQDLTGRKFTLNLR